MGGDIPAAMDKVTPWSNATRSSVCVCAAARVSYLDFFDAGVPVSHLLHVVHQLAVHRVQGLVHHHLESEHLAHVREHLAQHFVPVTLGEGKAESVSQTVPREVVESPSLEIFKTCLDKVLCSLLWMTLLGQGLD